MQLSLTFLNTDTSYKTFQKSGKQDSFKSYLRVQLICKKVQYLEPPTEYNQQQTRPFDKSKLGMTFLTTLRVTENYTVPD